MTIELVDGKAGTAHISSEDKAIIHQAKFSKSDVVFDWGDAFKCSMSSSNRATIGTGCASIQGLDWHITAAESVTISNGSQGMKRNDLICAHYNRSPKTGNELVELVVLKGSPNATAAADPKVPSGKILSGAVDAYMPLWRIPLDGITVGTPVRLFTPRGALWDSVTQTLIDCLYGKVTGVKTGNVVQILVEWKSAATASWDTGNFGVLPAGWRPLITTRWAYSGRDGSSQRDFTILPDGKFTYRNLGGSQNGEGFVTSASYITA